MQIEELERNLKTGKTDNIYLLYGEEQYLIEQCVKKIKKNFGELVNGINYILERFVFRVHKIIHIGSVKLPGEIGQRVGENSHDEFVLS